VFGATDVTPPRNVSELAAIVSDANGLLADRQRALNQIRAQKLASAGPALLRVAQQQPSYAVHELQINAVVTLFELADARAPLAAKGLLSPASHDIDEKEELLLGLGRLNDASSLNVMADTLSCGRLYDELFAASALALRQEPEAETVLIQKFFDPNTEGDIFGAIWTHFAESDTDRGALALFEWAVPRRIVRDALTDIIKRWIAARGATAVTQLATFANSSNLGVARLAGGFLSRCTGQGLASDVAAWTAWASRQPPTYWTAVSKDPECSLPGVPEEGAPGDGSRYLELVQADRSFHTRGIPGPPLGHYDAYFRALKAPFWPYMLTVGHMCGPLGEGQGRNRARYLGRRDYVRLGETFSAGFDYEDFTALGGSWAKRIPCSSEDALADDEGELIFFVGEEKYRFRFRYKTLPYHPEPVP
jgi:hypothetical protein